MTTCRICSNPLGSTLELGMQPICNRYLRNKNDSQKFYPLSLSICHSCATVQLSKLIPYNEITPPYGWLRYNEP